MTSACHAVSPAEAVGSCSSCSGSIHSARVLVCSEQTRNLLKRFIGRAQDPAARLTDIEYEEVLS